MSKYAVFGNPISHSLSPQLHQLFAQQFNMTMDYQKILVPLDQFKNAVDHFRAQGGVGANITSPFKIQAFEYADQLTNRAKISGTVNTFIFKNNDCIGDNTDGVGFIRDLYKKNISLENKNILLLGAGGAARSIVGEIIRENPKKMGIHNRTIEKAKKLAEDFGCEWGCECECEWDVIINATTQFTGTIKNCSDAIFYDLNYGERHKTFYEYATSLGATKIYGGFGMLAEQAAESFFQWFGGMPKNNAIVCASEIIRA
ncbi:MAG: shikimate dehydrogenase [Gammaproteobacteria bacterium RIFCSPHIGHO2_12_FULL_39_24]|nr:MAG: shikimate dehydrogenase [Gammaproteobacteria bacterium RIFCSPHIGHO2_12_FULL_39_24]